MGKVAGLVKGGRGALAAMLLGALAKGSLEYARLGNEKLLVNVIKDRNIVGIIVTLKLQDGVVSLNPSQQRAILEYWYKFSRSMFSADALPAWLRSAQ